MKPASLPVSRLGNHGPMVGDQGLGCMGMSEFYGATDQHAARSTLERALELGVNLFDTADMYGCGENETFLAPFFQQNREKVIIASKFGYVRGPGNPDDWSLDNRPGYIKAAVERSLQRLGVDCIDLYYMHRRVADVPLEESIGAMADLVTQGKVKWLGLCEVTAEELLAANKVHPISALQSQWSLFARGIEEQVVPAAVASGIAIVPYAPLGRGLLTSSAFTQQLSQGDARQHFPRFQAQNHSANHKLVERIERVAAERGITCAQVALAWLYTRAGEAGVTAVPIPGTRQVHRLEENTAAATLRLSTAEMLELETLAACVQGVAI